MTWRNTPPQRVRSAMLGLALSVVLGATLGCQSQTYGPEQDSGNSAGQQLNVFVGIPPVAYLVQRVGGSHVQVNILIEPGRDPHVYEPTPRRMGALIKARLFFKIDMPFEDRLIERIAQRHLPLEVVDTTCGITKRTTEGQPCEHDGAASDHDHETFGAAPDPHVWLAPANLKIMAHNIAEALCRADPDHAGEYRANLTKLNADLDALDARIAKILSPYRGQSFYVFHPAFGYFADAYGLKQQAVEMEGKSPTPKQLQKLVAKARSENVRVIFLQPEFDSRSAEAVASAIGGAVVPMDSLAEDVIHSLDDAARSIAASLRTDKSD